MRKAVTQPECSLPEYNRYNKMPDKLSNESFDTVTLPTIDAADQAGYAALVSGAAILARPTAGVLRLTDADRHDFLQRMTTNNIAALRPGESAVTVLTSPTARVLYVFTVIARSDDLLLLPAPGQSQALARHLRGQIFFMDKVKVADLGEEWARMRVMGPRAAQLLAALGNEVASPAPNAALLQENLVVVAQPHYEVPGFEVLAQSDQLATINDTLLAAGARAVSGDVYEARRVELGRPAAGAELVEEYNPLEAGLAWACAENKGCYTGQEIIARQITYDKVTKTLVGLRLEGSVAQGSDVMVEGRPVGTVTSVAYSPGLNAPIALAIIKRPHNTPGTPVEVGGQAATVATLPFVAE
jgi:folate-binding protein YgfZ